MWLGGKEVGKDTGNLAEGKKKNQDLSTDSNNVLKDTIALDPSKDQG